MDVYSSLKGIAVLLTVMLVLMLIEALIPLRKRTAWSKRHLFPNIALTLLTFTTNAAFNIPLLLGLVWFQANGLGLFNVVDLPPWLEIAGAILALDLAWYVTHRAMHMFPALWPVHTVHHSDPAVDVTTTVRQHPGESVLRYLFLAGFGFAFGVSPYAFAIYRIWSAVHGQTEHANIRLPQWLDTTITLVFSSPNLHKIHHSRDQRFTDTNYGNIFSIWDRMFGTFTPSKLGREIDYGLDGYDDPAQQTTLGLLAVPFRGRRASGVAEEGR